MKHSYFILQKRVSYSFIYRRFFPLYFLLFCPPARLPLLPPPLLPDRVGFFRFPASLSFCGFSSLADLFGARFSSRSQQSSQILSGPCCCSAVQPTRRKDPGFRLDSISSNRIFKLARRSSRSWPQEAELIVVISGGTQLLSSSSSLNPASYNTPEDTHFYTNWYTQ